MRCEPRTRGALQWLGLPCGPPRPPAPTESLPVRPYRPAARTAACPDRRPAGRCRLQCQPLGGSRRRHDDRRGLGRAQGRHRHRRRRPQDGPEGGPRHDADQLEGRRAQGPDPGHRQGRHEGRHRAPARPDLQRHERQAPRRRLCQGPPAPRATASAARDLVAGFTEGLLGATKGSPHRSSPSRRPKGFGDAGQRASSASRAPTPSSSSPTSPTCARGLTQVDGTQAASPAGLPTVEFKNGPTKEPTVTVPKSAAPTTTQAGHPHPGQGRHGPEGPDHQRPVPRRPLEGRQRLRLLVAAQRGRATSRSASAASSPGGTRPSSARRSAAASCSSSRRTDGYGKAGSARTRSPAPTRSSSSSTSSTPTDRGTRPASGPHRVHRRKGTRSMALDPRPHEARDRLPRGRGAGRPGHRGRHRGRRPRGQGRRHGQRALRRRRALDRRGVRLVLEPRRAARLPARRRHGHPRVGQGHRGHEGRRSPQADHPAAPRLRRPWRGRCHRPGETLIFVVDLDDVR